MQPYTKYCLEYDTCKEYIRKSREKNELFDKFLSVRFFFKIQLFYKPLLLAEINGRVIISHDAFDLYC